jgi:rhodanese-related sulfurtransferase
MKVVIQVAEADDAKAWALLQRHSPGVALPNRTFVVSQEAVAALRQAGIRFVILSDDARTLTEEGVASGERI